TSAYTPLGLCATSSRIAEFFDDHFFAHGHTYEAHPLVLAPAIATIREMQRLNLVERAREMGAYLGKKLSALAPAHPSIGQVRGLGLFWAVDLVKSRITKQPLNSISERLEPQPLIADRVAAEMMKLGVAVLPWISHVIIAPPLIIKKEEIDLGVDALDRALAIADQCVEN